MVTITGGDKLQAALEKIGARLTTAASVEIGYPSGGTYPDGTSVPTVAAINEFGRPDQGQPPRPFMRNTVRQHSAEWPDVILKALQASGNDAATALGLLGAQVAGEIQQEIATLTSPALSPVTIAKKGSSKPLVETGQLLQEVKFVVK